MCLSCSPCFMSYRRAVAFRSRYLTQTNVRATREMVLTREEEPASNDKPGVNFVREGSYRMQDCHDPNTTTHFVLVARFTTDQSPGNDSTYSPSVV